MLLVSSPLLATGTGEAIRRTPNHARLKLVAVSAWRMMTVTGLSTLRTRTGSVRRTEADVETALAIARASQRTDRLMVQALPEHVAEEWAEVFVDATGAASRLLDRAGRCLARRPAFFLFSGDPNMVRVWSARQLPLAVRLIRQTGATEIHPSSPRRLSSGSSSDRHGHSASTLALLMNLQ